MASFFKNLFSGGNNTEEEVLKALNLMDRCQNEEGWNIILKNMKKDRSGVIRVLESKDSYSALNTLFVIYQSMGKDPKEIFKICKRLADEGYLDGMVNTAQSYLVGKGVEKDEKKAFNLFKEVAETPLLSRNNMSDITIQECAKNMMAECYDNGWGVKQDPKKAFEVLMELAEIGRSEWGKKALARIAERYYMGAGVEKDMDEAFKWANKAAEEDVNGDGLNILAVCYMLGLGTPKNEKKAVSYYKEAAKKNHVKALKNLVVCYINGTGVSKDPDKAFEYAKKAANLGDVEMQALLQRH